MTNLHDHIVNIEGVDYVPLKIAQEAVAETLQIGDYHTKLTDTMAEFQKALKEIDSTLEDIDSND